MGSENPSPSKVREAPLPDRVEDVPAGGERY
jgi:hypothetical protein